MRRGEEELPSGSSPDVGSLPWYTCVRVNINRRGGKVECEERERGGL